MRQMLWKVKKINFFQTNVYPVDNKGGFVVEAAVIIPISLFLIVWLITISFNLFNRCSLERACAISALRGSQDIFATNNEKYRIADQSFAKLLEINLLAAGEIYKEITVKGDKITVFLETASKQEKFSTVATKKSINPVAFIRTCRKIKGVSYNHDAGGI